jgi:hypothetical protein
MKSRLSKDSEMTTRKFYTKYWAEDKHFSMLMDFVGPDNTITEKFIQNMPPSVRSVWGSFIITTTGPSLTLKELKEEIEELFRSYGGNLFCWIIEATISMNDLAQHPTCSSLTLKDYDEYERIDKVIASALIKPEYISKIFLSEDPSYLDVNFHPEGFVNQTFLDSQQQKQQEQAFLAGKILGKIDEQESKLFGSKFSPNSVLVFSQNKTCDFGNLSKMIFSFLHNPRKQVKDSKSTTEKSISETDTAQNRPGGK